MANGNGKLLGNGRSAHLGWFVSGLLGASGGTLVIGVSPFGESLFRQDPATGAELRLLQDSINNHLLTHPDNALRMTQSNQQIEIDHLNDELEELKDRIRALESR